MGRIFFDIESAPATPSSSGQIGDIVCTETDMYLCVAEDTWKRFISTSDFESQLETLEFASVEDVVTGEDTDKIVTPYALRNSGARESMTSTVYFNVDTAAQISEAMNDIASMDCKTFSPIIKLADGYYNAGDVQLKNILGSGYVYIMGNTTNPSNVVFDGGIIKTSTGTPFIISGIKFNKTSSPSLVSINAGYGALIYYGTVIFGSGYTVHNKANNGGIVICNGSYTVEGSAAYHWYAIDGSQIGCSNRTVTITGTPTMSYWAKASVMSIINGEVTTYNGDISGGKLYTGQNAFIKMGAYSMPGTTITEADGGRYS